MNGNLVQVNEDNIRVIQNEAAMDVDIQIQTAKRYPRNMEKFQKQSIMLATSSQEIASECFYSYERGGKKIKGPSVRLSEIIANSWGNLRIGTIVTMDGLNPNDKFIEVRGVCHDLENNNVWTMTSRRNIMTSPKSGPSVQYSQDMILMTVNACSAIISRNVILKAIPRAYTNVISNEVMRVAVGDSTQSTLRFEAGVKKYAEFGITEEQLLSKLGKLSKTEIGPKDIEIMQGLYNAIKDGQIDVHEEFMPPADKKAAPQVETQAPPAPKAAEAKKAEKPTATKLTAEQEFNALAIKVEKKKGPTYVAELITIYEGAVKKKKAEWQDDTYGQINEDLRKII